MDKLKALQKTLSKKSNIVLLVSAAAVILSAFGIQFSESSQTEVTELITSLVAVAGIVSGIAVSEKEVKAEVDKAKAEK